MVLGGISLNLEGELNNSESTDYSSESEQTSSNEQLDNQTSNVLDLDSAERVKFEGREWTREELRNAYMMQSDYTRKTQALAEERKYYDNLDADLEHVRRNPALANEFMRVYPAKFHRFLDMGKGSSQQATQYGQQNNTGSNQHYQNLEQKLQRIEADMLERNVQAIQSQLDSKFEVLSKRYPMADEEAVLSRAESLLNKGTELTDRVWDLLWKSVNDRNVELAKQYYSKQVNNQKTANQRGKDIAPGGGTPGQAPRRPKTIKEASQWALADLEANG